MQLILPLGKTENLQLFASNRKFMASEHFRFYFKVFNPFYQKKIWEIFGFGY